MRSICVVCGKGRYESSVSAVIHSNVRKFREHISTLWRCEFCGSVHQLECEDLAVFYEYYPFSLRRLDSFTRTVFLYYVRRLVKHGLKMTDAILDYGCSEGMLLDFLRELGYKNCEGYDPFSKKYSDKSVLSRKYDLVISQDVIEHVEDPRREMSVIGIWSIRQACCVSALHGQTV